MMLAGLFVRPELVRELAELVYEPTASVLELALDRKIAVVALTIEDRERILRALDDPPPGSRSFAACCFASTSGGCMRGWSSCAWSLIRHTVAQGSRLTAPCLLIGGARCMQWP
jgi:hypothetical protein